jgi:hypothetical protein
MKSNLYSGYAISRRDGLKDHLIGLLKIRDPLAESMEWLTLLEVMFGEYKLFQMTNDGGMGLACNMDISPESLPFVTPFPIESAPAFHAALTSYLATPPQVDLELRFDLTVDHWATRCVTEPLGTIPGKPRFLLGNPMASRRAKEALAEDASQIARLLRRHVTADWGEISAEQRRRNFWAIHNGGLIMSQHEVFGGERIYLVTDADRSRTSFLLPSEGTNRATEPVSLLTDREKEMDDRQ